MENDLSAVATVTGSNENILNKQFKSGKNDLASRSTFKVLIMFDDLSSGGVFFHLCCIQLLQRQYCSMVNYFDEIQINHLH